MFNINTCILIRWTSHPRGVRWSWDLANISGSCMDPCPVLDVFCVTDKPSQVREALNVWNLKQINNQCFILNILDLSEKNFIYLITFWNSYLLLGLNAIANNTKNLASSNFIAHNFTSFSQFERTHCCMLFFHDETASSVNILVKDNVSASL